MTRPTAMIAAISTTGTISRARNTQRSTRGRRLREAYGVAPVRLTAVCHLGSRVPPTSVAHLAGRGGARPRR